VFGTLYRPPGWPQQYGCDGYVPDHGYLAQLAAPWRKDRAVPPRSQAAHQEASHLVEAYARRLKGKAPAPYHYRDFGSLVSLGQYDTVGQLMGFIGNEKFRVEGWVAKFFYISLYRQHVWALHGFWRMALDTLARMILHQVEPKVKLH